MPGVHLSFKIVDAEAWLSPQSFLARSYPRAQRWKSSIPNEEDGFEPSYVKKGIRCERICSSHLVDPAGKLEPLRILALRLPIDNWKGHVQTLVTRNCEPVTPGRMELCADELSVRCFWWVLARIQFYFLVFHLVFDLYGATNKQVSSMEAALECAAGHLTAVSRCTHAVVCIIKNIGLSGLSRR